MDEVTKRASRNEGVRATVEIDDTRRPVWLEATESFYKKLNRIAEACELSRYQALSKGLDALMREMEIRNCGIPPIDLGSLSRRYSGICPRNRHSNSCLWLTRLSK